MEDAWSPAMITTVFTGLIGLLGAITAMVVALRGSAQSKKAAENIKAQVVEVHDLVNAGNSALLKRVKRLTARVAFLSKNRNDQIEADAASDEVVAKDVITADATAKRTEADKREQ